MFEGHADWRKIAKMKQSVKIPVIGSGDLFTASDVTAMLAETRCDGVMVARGALGNPWIFSQALALLDGREQAPPAPEERLRAALRHLELFTELSGERVALREMRKHFGWYSHGLAGAAQFRKAVNIIEGKGALLEAMHRFFSPEAP